MTARVVWSARPRRHSTIMPEAAPRRCPGKGCRLRVNDLRAPMCTSCMIQRARSRLGEQIRDNGPPKETCRRRAMSQPHFSISSIQHLLNNVSESVLVKEIIADDRIPSNRLNRNPHWIPWALANKIPLSERTRRAAAITPRPCIQPQFKITTSPASTECYDASFDFKKFCRIEARV